MLARPADGDIKELRAVVAGMISLKKPSNKTTAANTFGNIHNYRRFLITLIMVNRCGFRTSEAFIVKDSADEFGLRRVGRTNAQRATIFDATRLANLS